MIIIIILLLQTVNSNWKNMMPKNPKVSASTSAGPLAQTLYFIPFQRSKQGRQQTKRGGKKRKKRI